MRSEAGTVKSKNTVPADPISQGKFNINSSISFTTNIILAANEIFPNVLNMKNNKLKPSVLFNLKLWKICGIRADKYNAADMYPSNFGPMSSALLGGGVSRGWFPEERDHPNIPAPMTRPNAPRYWRTTLARLAGGDSTKDARRGRRGFEDVRRTELVERLR
jgi:hypothetical protein